MHVKLHILPHMHDIEFLQQLFTQRFSFLLALKMRKMRFEEVKKLTQRLNAKFFFTMYENREELYHRFQGRQKHLLKDHKSMCFLIVIILITIKIITSSILL